MIGLTLSLLQICNYIKKGVEVYYIRSRIKNQETFFPIVIKLKIKGQVTFRIPFSFKKVILLV